MKYSCFLLVFVGPLLMIGCESENSTDPDEKKRFDIELNDNIYYDEEIFDGQKLGIYNDWVAYNISGGFAGDGYSLDFDQLTIQTIGIFKFYRNDSLLNYGKIEIITEDEIGLLIEFVLDSITGTMLFEDMEKYLYLNNDSLHLYGPCCDRYNYHFTEK